MTRRYILMLAGLGIALLVTTPVLSCTTVCLLEKEKAVVAYNYDFHPPEGLVLVNKRDTKKMSALRKQGATWAATYGSVTFNQFGRDKPMTGINEKGLMVSQMWLDETRYPPADSRPAIGILDERSAHITRASGGDVESAFTKTRFLREVPAAARDAMAANPGTTSSCAAAS